LSTLVICNKMLATTTTRQSLTSRLIWQTCASDCCWEQGPQSTRRCSLYWISQMLSGSSQQIKTKHAIPRKSKQDHFGIERTPPSCIPCTLDKYTVVLVLFTFPSTQAAP
jgi:hypothetical protein